MERFLIREGLYDPGIFKAFFLAGGPGSGKTFVTKKITGGLGLKNVNSDTAFETALKKAGLSLDMPASQEKERDEIRARSKQLTAKRLDLYIMGRLGLVIDSTARDTKKIEIGLSALKRLGYDCYMVFVNTSLDVALARNAKRDRKVPRDITIKSHKQIQANMGYLQRIFDMTLILALASAALVGASSFLSIFFNEGVTSLLDFLAQTFLRFCNCLSVIVPLKVGSFLRDNAPIVISSISSSSVFISSICFLRSAILLALSSLSCAF